MVKTFDFPNLKTTIESLLAAVTAQNDHLAKWSESSASMAWSDGPRMTRNENTQANFYVPKTTLAIIGVSQPKSPSDTTLKHDKGKRIARDTNESPPKLVKASTKVRLDPDTPAERERHNNWNLRFALMDLNAIKAFRKE
nr:hypothetical protein [Tanacetum cinerariifolium]